MFNIFTKGVRRAFNGVRITRSWNLPSISLSYPNWKPCDRKITYVVCKCVKFVTRDKQLLK